MVMARIHVLVQRGAVCVAACLMALVSVLAAAAPARASVTELMQSIASAAARDADLATFYKGNGFEPIWVGGSDRARARRAQLLHVLAASDDHGLPVARYDPEGLRARMDAARGPSELGQLDVDLSAAFLQYARDVQTGMLVPSRVDSAIVRDVPYRDRVDTLVRFETTEPAGFFRSLPPASPEYAALMKEKMRLERLLARGGFGPTVPGNTLEPGAAGDAVVALRNRLMVMGYLRRSNTRTYDTDIEQAVQRFQAGHGLTEDGVAGQGTLAEINAPLDARLQSVIVAMERERWTNLDRGARHILVNIPDFTAKVIDDGKVTFETRSVVGARASDRPTPEFSDVMEFMVINPSWYVPRSIVTKEYLPQLKNNPFAAQHIEITDARGRKVNRGAVDFSQYTARSFPYAMRQPPSRSNALGLVKFMFPNRYNIYLHDTPAKNLFGREVRAYSHGCVRLADPFDFAYTLLAAQSDDPEGLFQSLLATGRETRVDLTRPVPVHLIYRTAFTTPKGQVEYRRDIYGRDAKIWDALRDAGVALRAVQG